MAEKITGILTFDINSGTFWITCEDESPLTKIQFGDSFEVKVGEDWIPTKIEIGSDSEGALIFKLKDTPYEGMLDGLDVRM